MEEEEEACYQQSEGKKFVALKKRIKQQNMESPSRKEFKAFAEFAVKMREGGKEREREGERERERGREGTNERGR